MSKKLASILKLTYIVLTIILSIIVTNNGVLGQIGQQHVPKPKISMLFPKTGEAFSPGQKVRIAWNIDLSPKIKLSWCEQEIFLSIDGGKTFSYRITPELSPSLREYIWTVPNLPTDQAVLDIRFGSEFSQTRFEKSQPQKRNMFRILPSASAVQEVKLFIPQVKKLLPGDHLDLNWFTETTDIDSFELLISYDQGAHFHSLTKTKDNHFTWTVPNDFSGTVGFKVVVQKTDGSRLESLFDAQPLIVTRGEGGN